MALLDMTATRRLRDEAAPLEEFLDRVSGKWTIRILSGLRHPRRFTELERSLDGISRRMLTLTLRNLERDGLVVRTVFPTVPPKVEYALSPLGSELLDSLTPLTAWVERNRSVLEAARNAYRDRAAA
ncbi:helix-turn-helix domain-containing protein [Streptomyces sp. NPDC020807]|uniref:winged helix-turn-helix transcriptional regulator n=1 Tax=Streptomyces sp. NPDC020807 TaxID=3155119 RepID=UPI0033E8E853